MLYYSHWKIFLLSSYWINSGNNVTNSTNSGSGRFLLNQNIAISHLPTLNNQISYWFNSPSLCCLLFCTPSSPPTPVKCLSESTSQCYRYHHADSLEKASVSQASTSNTAWSLRQTLTLRTLRSPNSLSKVACGCLVLSKCHSRLWRQNDKPR